MKNPFRKLDQLQHDLGEIAVQFIHFEHFSTTRSWQPAVNAFRCGELFIVCVELAGVEKDAFEVRAEPRRLILRGNRPPPEPNCEEPMMQVLALEIDHGPFERVIELPAEVEAGQVTAEHRNGLLWIQLPLRSHV